MNNRMYFGKRNKNNSVGLVVDNDKTVDVNNAFSIRKIISKMSSKKIMNNKKSSKSSSSSLSLSSLSSSLSTTNSEHSDREQNQRDQLLQLSKLSTMMTQFVVESAQKTHDSIDDEEGRREFLEHLRDEMRSEVLAPVGNYQKKEKKNGDKNEKQEKQVQNSDVDNDKKDSSSSFASLNDNPNPNPKLNSNSNCNSRMRRDAMNIIDFLVKTSQGTLESMTQEEERNAFKQHLHRSIQKEFSPSTITLTTTQRG